MSKIRRVKRQHKRILTLFSVNASTNVLIEFLAVFGRMPGALEEGFVRRANPEGIESISPGLRGTSYPTAVQL
jgi:hypothetical protein